MRLSEQAGGYQTQYVVPCSVLTIYVEQTREGGIWDMVVWVMYTP